MTPQQLDQWYRNLVHQLQQQHSNRRTALGEAYSDRSTIRPEVQTLVVSVLGVGGAGLLAEFGILLSKQIISAAVAMLVIALLTIVLILLMVGVPALNPWLARRHATYWYEQEIFREDQHFQRQLRNARERYIEYSQAQGYTPQPLQVNPPGPPDPSDPYYRLGAQYGTDAPRDAVPVRRTRVIRPKRRPSRDDEP